MVEIRLLGPVEVLRDGKAVDLGGRKQRTVLAVLASRLGDWVSEDQLIHAVWGDEAPEAAVRSLQTYVSNLRSLLDPDREGLVQREQGGYRLRSELSDIDARRFEELLTSPVNESVEELSSVLGLWRGRPLGELADEKWASEAVAHWQRLYVAGNERLMEARLESREDAGLVDELERLVVEYPFHEPFWRQLMIALYRSGRQSDALEAFRRLRRLLGEELGIDPQPELAELEERILLQDEMLLWPVSSTFRPEFLSIFTACILDEAGEQPLSIPGESLAKMRRVVEETAERFGGWVFGETVQTVSAAFTSVSNSLQAAQECDMDLDGLQGNSFGIGFGIHCGEITSDTELIDSELFGLSLQFASASSPGQIICSQTVIELASDKSLKDGYQAVAYGEYHLAESDTPAVLHGVQRASRTRQYSGPRLPTPRHWLPAMPNLRGRGEDIREIVRLLEPDNVVTLTGAGGVGKTSLALAVAHETLDRYPAGAYFVDLIPESDPDLVIQAVADVLEVMDDETTQVEELVIRRISGKRMLIVMDNCEHLIEGAARVVEILHSAPRVTVMTTSREPLKINGEIAWRVPSLELPPIDKSPSDLGQNPAVELFLDSIEGIPSSRFTHSPHLETIAKICRQLGGIPLAIELAAPHIAVFPPAELLERLEKRLDLLYDTSRSTTPRHQTLRATIDWSYQLLNAHEKKMFLSISVFPAPFDAEAAVSVTDLGDFAAVDAFTNLVSKSLIFHSDSHSDTAFEMPETIRQFAIEVLNEKRPFGLTWEELRGAHAELYLERLKTATIDSSREPIDVDHVRAAAEWLSTSGLSDALVESFDRIWPVYQSRARYREAARVICNAADTSGLSRTDRAYLRAMAAEALQHSGRFEASLDLVRRAGVDIGMRVPASDFGWASRLVAEVARQVGHRVSGAVARSDRRRELGYLRAHMLGETATASFFLDEPTRMAVCSVWALNEAELAPIEPMVAQAKAAVGFGAAYLGLHRLAKKYIQEAADWTADHDEVDDGFGRWRGTGRWHAGLVLVTVGMYWIRAGELEKAETVLRKSSAISRARSDPEGVDGAENLLPDLYIMKGDVEAAESYASSLLAKGRRTENVATQVWGLLSLSEALLAQGRHTGFARLAGETIELIDHADRHTDAARAGAHMGRVHLQRGQIQLALGALQKSVELAGTEPSTHPDGVLVYLSISELALDLVPAAPDKREDILGLLTDMIKLFRKFQRGAPMAHPGVLLIEGRLALLKNRVSKGRDLLEQARTGAERLGMRLIEAAATDAMGGLRHQSD